MPARKAGGASGGGSSPPPPSAPASPVQNVLADAANATIIFSLPGEDRVQNALTQCSVKCSTDILVGGVADPFGGPVYAELWLLRDAGGFAMQLDSGFVQGGGYRTTIGVVGSIMYMPGDQLVIFMWNDSGAAFGYKVEFATDTFDPDMVASTGAYTKLSKKHEATWTYRVTMLNNGANAGNHYVEWNFADGLMGYCLFDIIMNADTVARAAYIQLSGATGAYLVATLANNAALGAGAELPWPNGVVYPGIGMKLMVPPSLEVYNTIAAIAISQDSVHAVVFCIESRPPTVILTGPVGVTNTVTAGSNEVR